MDDSSNTGCESDKGIHLHVHNVHIILHGKNCSWREGKRHEEKTSLPSIPKGIGITQTPGTAPLISI